MRLTAFRHVAYDTPWWAFPGPESGRFHRGRTQTVQYLSLHPLGPAAEMLRHHVGPHGDPDTVVLNLWAAHLDLDADVESVIRIDFGDCHSYGLTPEQLVGDDYRPTQALADAVRHTASAMIVPSAALPGTDNLILFGPRLLHPFASTPISPEEVRTGHLSDAARAPAEVAPHVRWFGAPHPSVRQWRATGSYPLFDDPLPTRW